MNSYPFRISFYNEDRKKRQISFVQLSPLDSAQRKRYIKQIQNQNQKQEEDEILDFKLKT